MDPMGLFLKGLGGKGGKHDFGFGGQQVLRKWFLVRARCMYLDRKKPLWRFESCDHDLVHLWYYHTECCYRWFTLAGLVSLQKNISSMDMSRHRGVGEVPLDGFSQSIFFGTGWNGMGIEGVFFEGKFHNKYKGNIRRLKWRRIE